MKIGLVVVTYSIIPTVLVESIKSNHTLRWYINHHGAAGMNKELIECFQRENSKIYLYNENRGLSKSWNDGIVESIKNDDDITLIINDDIEFLNGCFDEWINFIEHRKDHGLIFLHGKEPQEDGGEIIRDQGFSCFSIGRQAKQMVGAFDENFIPAYFEDFDYMVRCTKSGVSVEVDPRVHVIHRRSFTVRNSAEIADSFPVFFEKNKLYMIAKWGGSDPWNTTYDKPFGNPDNSVFIPFGERKS